MALKTLAVVNPNSAGGTTKKNWPIIMDLMGVRVPGFEYVFTSGQGHATSLTRSGIKNGFEMIVAIGGDGTNNEVVNGFFEDGKPLNPDAVFAHITQGTGGDLRKTLGTPKDIKKACANLAQGGTKNIDVGKMTLVDHEGNLVQRYFLNIVSFGIGGDVDARVNRSSKMLGGTASFAIASAVSMFTYRNKPVTIKLDGKALDEQKVFSCAVANGRYFGGGMMMAPDAYMDDGLFDVVIIGDMSLPEKLIEMRKIYSGSHVSHPKVSCYKAAKIEAGSSEEVLLDVDGEQPGRLPATFEVMPGALKVRTPEN